MPQLLEIFNRFSKRNFRFGLRGQRTELRVGVNGDNPQVVLSSPQTGVSAEVFAFGDTQKLVEQGITITVQGVAFNQQAQARAGLTLHP